MAQVEKQGRPVSRQSRAFGTLNKFDLEGVPMAEAPGEDSNDVLPVERSSNQSRMPSIKVGLGLNLCSHLTK